VAKCLVPEGQLSSVTDDESSLTRSSSTSEFSDFLPDTSTYFAAWVESVRPSLNPEDNPVPATESFPRTPNEVEHALPRSEFTFDGSLRIDCYVKGVIPSQTGTLIVSETGDVEADIFVPIAIIDGLVRGNIRATERVELGSHARVIGNIETPALSIQPGAIFKGQVHFLPAATRSNVQHNGQDHADDTAFPMPSSPEFPSAAEEKEAKPLAVAAGR
jgi:cytoskeletal protein CcmA (bactofilin family)